MYHEIHQQKRTGKQSSQIASFLGMDTRTVKKYLAMSVQEFDAYQVKLEQRTKKLASYEDFIHRRLSDCPEASSAQVHDWLKEFLLVKKSLILLTLVLKCSNLLS